MANQETASISQRVLRTLLGVVLPRTPDKGLRRTPDQALRGFATTGNLFGIRVALAAGADINGSEALGLASYFGKTKAVRLLLDEKADVNAMGDYGSTPLYLAVFAHQGKTAKLLIKRGADVNGHATDGEVPLHAACCHQDKYLTEFLIRAGATIDARDRWGKTPLHVASSHASLDSFLYLLEEAGANASLQADDGRTALDMARTTLYPENPDARARIITELLKRDSIPQTPTIAFSTSTPTPSANAQGAGPVSPKAKQGPISRRMVLAMT